MNNNLDLNTLRWVTLKEDDDFLKIIETLTRIGIKSKHDNTIWQSCHILHKQGRYAIVHFKELFALDGKETNITEEDLARRDYIVKMLTDWGLCEPETPFEFSDSHPSTFIVKFKDKGNYNLKSKYDLGSADSTRSNHD